MGTIAKTMRFLNVRKATTVWAVGTSNKPGPVLLASGSLKWHPECAVLASEALTASNLVLQSPRSALQGIAVTSKS